MARKSLASGTRIGPYTIRSEVRQDASGISYDADIDDTSVSLREFFPERLSQRRKLTVFAPRRTLKAELESALGTQRERFELYLALKSPVLADGLAVLNENGTVYLATARPSGQSLGRMSAQDGLFAPGFARSMLGDLTSGLQDLADVGLVHGAISPETIILADTGCPVVMHPALPDARSGVMSVNELDGPLSGYIPPELVRDDPAGTGPWSDVYALAASFYMLITGRMPASAVARTEVLKAGEEDSLDLALLEERLFDDPALYGAIEQALKLDVGTRLSSMAAFYDAMMFVSPPAPEPVRRNEDTEGTAGVIPSRQGLWSGYGRSFIAAGTVICLLALSIPLMLSIDHKASDSLAETAGSQDPVVNADLPGKNTGKAPVLASEDEISKTPSDPDPVPVDEIIPASVAEWEATDQTDPEAVSALYERYADDEAISAQVRQRWTELDNTAWQTAKDENTLTSFEGYVERFDTGLRLNGAYLSDARGLIDTLSAEKEKEALARAEAERAAEEAARGPKPGDVITDCEDCPELVVLSPQGGQTPQLAVMRSEVTTGDFRAFIAATGRPVASGCIVSQEGSASPWTYGSANSFEDPGYPVSDAHPATCVSFDDATGYADWLSRKTGEAYRLPTAEDWTLAADQTSRKPTMATACERSNFADTSLAGKLQNMQIANCSDGQAFAASAGSMTASKTAVLDMYGNVAEWVSDCVDAGCSTHPALGGSWASGPGIIGSGLRESYTAGSRNSALGFRLIRVL